MSDPESSKSGKPPRVHGLGGVFFKAKDPKALGDWYRRHLGLDVLDWGGVAFHFTLDSADRLP